MFAAICVPGMCQLAMYVCIAGCFTVRLLQSQGGSAYLVCPISRAVFASLSPHIISVALLENGDLKLLPVTLTGI